MFRTLRLLSALAIALACTTHISVAAPAAAQEPVNSALNRDLFYELLVGELSAQAGDHGSAYALLLDAARKSNSERLYQRAVEVALGARSGDAALEAARAWMRAFPTSQDANRYLLQILVGMNRLADIVEPLKLHLAALPAAERAGVIQSLPRYFARATDKKQLSKTIEQALVPELSNNASGAAAWSTIGLLRLQAGDAAGSLEAANRALALQPKAEEPVWLILNAMSAKVPQAELLVQKHLTAQSSAELRMGYVRNLLDAQRYEEAYTQVQKITQNWPKFADSWLVRGTLEMQLHKLDLAQASLQSFLKLQPTPPTGETQEMARGTVQALLLLSQLSEQTQRYDTALEYLAQIDSPKDALRIAVRKASVMAHQGKLDDARQLIRNAPESQSEDGRTKWSAEIQLLRDHRKYQLAYEQLGAALIAHPQDSEFLYDQAMMAERIGKTDEMERILRQLIASKPDYHHAYNALGFSLAERNVRLNEARALVVKALEFAPEDPFIVDSLAWVEFRLGKTDEALRLLRQAYEKRPDAEIAAHLGEVLWTLGQRESALAIWQKGAQLSPENETLLETTLRLQGKP